MINTLLGGTAAMRAAGKTYLPKWPSEEEAFYQNRLTVAVGPEMAINVMYMNMYAFPAAAVADIDGEEYPLPQNPKQIESMLAILGKSGLKAVSASLRARSKDEEDEATEAAAKN